MNKVQQYLWYLVIAVAAFTTVWYTLFYMVEYPGSVLHELGGDAIKNYYTYVTHALYGDGFWFTGMNYPYGEHIVYVDGLPMLSLPLTYIREVIPITIADATAVLNISLVVGFFLAVIYTYKSLTAFKVHPVVALVAACLIVVMSPQVNRVFGHYGLGYLCVIPMTFYFLIQYYRSSKLKYVIYLAVIYVLMSFAHPYFVAIIAIWSFLYSLGYYWIAKRRDKAAWLHIGKLMIVPLIAIIVFKGVMSQTDPLTDRPENPYGTLSACTTGTDIFTSDNSKVWIYLQQQEVLKEIGSVGAEGAAYTGIIIIVVLIVTVITGLVYFIRRKKGAAYYHTEVEKIWFFIAITVLLAGMGVPFVWKMDWLLDYLSAFRQFRSLGRFALIYYNIATVSGVALLYHWTRRVSAKNKIAGIAILLLVGGIWAWEAKGFADRRRERSMGGTYNYDYFTSKHEESWNEFLSDNGYDSTDFQAIMTIPFVSVGSEKIWLFRGDWGGFCIATRASYQLKLPMISSIMSRSSWGRTFKQIKNASGPFGGRPTLDDMKSEKDFLLLDYEDYEKNPDESFYLSLADSIGHFHQYTVYKLGFNKLTEALANARQRGLDVADSLSTGDTSLAMMDYYYGHFDDLYKGEHFAGTGAQKQIQARDSVIFKLGIADWDKSQEYEVSIWALVNDFDYKGPLLELRCYNEANTEIGYFEFYANGSVYDTEDFWFRISRYFKMPEETKDITITTKYSGPDVYYAFDELLIRAAADTIVSKDVEGKVLVNNHLVK